MRYIFILVLFFSCSNKNLKSDIDQKVDDIISQMTLEEKVGQMTQINLTVIAKGPNKWESSFPMEIDDNKANRALVEFKVGSVLNTINNTAQKPNVWFNNISKIQDIAMNKNRLGIPVIYGIDAIHGTTYTDGATMFPQQITTAASWNPENAYNMALVCAYETRAVSYTHLRAHETRGNLVCRLLLEKKNTEIQYSNRPKKVVRVLRSISPI